MATRLPGQHYFYFYPFTPRMVLLSRPCAGESREKKDLIYLDANGHVKASKPVDEKLVERRREGVHPGKVRMRRHVSMHI